jgi:endonuclease YncB( thermonuclease family)
MRFRITNSFIFSLSPFNSMEAFRGCEREARENRRGLWKE